MNPALAVFVAAERAASRARSLERWLGIAGLLLIIGIVSLMAAVGSGSAEWFLAGILAFVLACLIFIGVCLIARKGARQ